MMEEWVQKNGKTWNAGDLEKWNDDGLVKV